MKTQVQDITGKQFVIHYDRFTKRIAILVRDENGNQINNTYHFKTKSQAYSFVHSNKLQRIGCAN
jgi:phage anti-repressor protein